MQLRNPAGFHYQKTYRWDKGINRTGWKAVSSDSCKQCVQAKSEMDFCKKVGEPVAGRFYLH